MNDIVGNFMKTVLDMRQRVINSGGHPTTIKVSRKAIEDMKTFGLDIVVVDPGVLPKDVCMMVIDERHKEKQSDDTR